MVRRHAMYAMQGPESCRRCIMAITFPPASRTAPFYPPSTPAHLPPTGPLPVVLGKRGALSPTSHRPVPFPFLILFKSPPMMRGSLPPRDPT